MKLNAVRVENYKSTEDSGGSGVRGLTCLAGKMSVAGDSHERMRERMFARAQELQDQGPEFDPIRAAGVAWLEERIRQWPPAWGDDLHILLYGDFHPPDSALEYPKLGITVHPEKQENTVIRGAKTVLVATVTVDDKSVDALVDAGRRINLLLGAITLHDWGNGRLGWWSWVTHEGAGGTILTLAHEDIEASIDAVLNLPDDVRKRIEAALFWVREPRNLIRDSYRSDVLRLYVSYWNAFECLVDAVMSLRSTDVLLKSAKQTKIDEAMQTAAGHLTAEQIEQLYRTIVNPEFVGKASQALRICFGEMGDQYEKECFRLTPSRDRLYDIRNAINHGAIDAEHPGELLRVGARQGVLWMIVWRMFGRLIAFPPRSIPMTSDR